MLCVPPCEARNKRLSLFSQPEKQMPFYKHTWRDMRLRGHNFREKISGNQRNKTHRIELQWKGARRSEVHLAVHAWSGRINRSIYSAALAMFYR